MRSIRDFCISTIVGFIMGNFSMDSSMGWGLSLISMNKSNTRESLMMEGKMVNFLWKNPGKNILDFFKMDSTKVKDV